MAKKENLDFVKWNFTANFNGKKKIVRTINSAVYQNSYEIFADYNNFRKTIDAVWNGIYKTEYIKSHNITFDDFMKYGGEDLYFSLQIIGGNPKGRINNKNYYQWMVRQEYSTSFKRNPNFCESMIKNARYEFNLYLKFSTNNEELWIRVKNDYVLLIKNYASEISQVYSKRINKMLLDETWNTTL